MKILSTGEKIRKQRKKLNMTLKDLAGDRITISQISLIESGKANPSIDLLKDLGESLNLPLEYLLESERSQALKLCKYYENMAFCFIYKKDLKEASSFLDKIDKVSKKYDIKEFKYKYLYIRGILSYEQESFNEARAYFLEGNIGFIHLKMYTELVESYIYLSYICINTKDNLSAIMYLSSAIKVIELHFPYHDILFFKVYYLISINYFKILDFYHGEFYLKKSMDILNKIYNPEENINSFIHKSIDYMDVDDLDNAMKFSRMSRDYFEIINRMKDRELVQIGISNKLIEDNDISKAILYLDRAKHIDSDFNFNNVFYIYKSFILLYIRNNDVSSAKEYLDKYQCSLNLDNIEYMLEFYMLKYKVHILEKSYGDAEIALILLYNFSKENGLYKEAGDALIYLSKLYLDIGRYVEASNSMDEALVQYNKNIN